MTAGQGKGTKRHSDPSVSPQLHVSWRLLPLLAALLLMVSCAGVRTAAATAAAAPAGPASPSLAPAPAKTPLAVASPSPVPSSLTLTIWGPDSMAPLDDVPGGAVLAAQIDAFVKAHPGWQVQYVRKKPYGQGGIVHFLQTTATVAPELLPDLVLVDMSEIGLLANGSLLQPLEGLVGDSAMADLMPFARQAGQVGEHLLAVQYEADLRFLAYNSAIVS